MVYLDTDLGQPEFTPAGLVSLHVISSPVFGPSFMHLASPLKCAPLAFLSFGDTAMCCQSLTCSPWPLLSCVCQGVLYG